MARSPDADRRDNWPIPRSAARRSNRWNIHRSPRKTLTSATYPGDLSLEILRPRTRNTAPVRANEITLRAVPNGDTNLITPEIQTSARSYRRGRGYQLLLNRAAHRRCSGSERTKFTSAYRPDTAADLAPSSARVASIAPAGLPSPTHPCQQHPRRTTFQF